MKATSSSPRPPMELRLSRRRSFSLSSVSRRAVLAAPHRPPVPPHRHTAAVPRRRHSRRASATL
eukprot:1407575-Prymnesium_polylepis.1